MPCPLCDAPSSTGDVVYEDDTALVVLHEDWSVRGHAMIVARRHVENPSDLDEGEWLAFARLWHRVERVLLDLTGAERAIAMKLGIQTPHLHVHLYPVSAGTTRDEVFAAIHATTHVPRDEELVARLSALLTRPPD